MPKTLVKRHFWSQIAVLPRRQRVRRPRRQLFSRGPPNQAFYEVSAPGASQGACMPKTLVKPHLWSQIAFLPSRQRCTALAANFSPGALQIVRFARFQLLGPHRGPACPKPLDIEGPGNNQRIDKLYDRNLDAQIFQKVRRTLCSISTKRSLPRRSGRSPLR